MRTSRRVLDESYLKIFQTEQTQGTQPQERIINVVPVKEEEPKSIIKRNKRYYEENKETILKQQKEYKDNRPAYDKTRVRILYNLNHDPDYYNSMREQTKKKYNFKQENGRWV